MAKAEAQAPEKPYHLELEYRSDYLYARISAPSISRQMALDYLGEVANECARKRCKRMLLDRDIPTMMPDDDMFATMADFVQMSRGIKIAFVNRHISIDDAMKHIVDYGIGRGADYRYFNDPALAERWLLEVSDPKE